MSNREVKTIHAFLATLPKELRFSLKDQFDEYLDSLVDTDEITTEEFYNWINPFN